MKTRHIIVVAIASVLIAALLMGFSFMGESTAEGDPLPVFVGVDVAYDSPEEIKTLVDAISPYTNFFVIGSTGITYNETRLADLCQYVYDKGLSFIIYVGTHGEVRPSSRWIAGAKEKWGDRFLGLMHTMRSAVNSWMFGSGELCAWQTITPTLGTNLLPC